jgi:enoyl-[acyl-carrier protein] reductase / trans-2-enoyl-CoA reductase (NAD+)
MWISKSTYVRAQFAAADVSEGPKRVLVVGASGGYGLSSRIVAAFGYGAQTLGVSFEKPPSENKTATAGWYNNHAFENRARDAGLYTRTIDGDAFSDELKEQVIEAIREIWGRSICLFIAWHRPYVRIRRPVLRTARTSSRSVTPTM